MYKVDSKMLRVHKNFKERVERFIEDFEKVNGIKISTTLATKIIDDKIENLGGLIA
jgi:hypothetical protein